MIRGNFSFLRSRQEVSKRLFSQKTVSKPEIEVTFCDLQTFIRLFLKTINSDNKTMGATPGMIKMTRDVAANKN